MSKGTQEWYVVRHSTNAESQFQSIAEASSGAVILNDTQSCFLSSFARNGGASINVFARERGGLELSPLSKTRSLRTRMPTSPKNLP